MTRPGREVHVRVGEAGQQAAAVEVDALGARAVLVERDDAVALDDERARDRPRRVHRPHDAAVEDGRHRSASAALSASIGGIDTGSSPRRTARYSETRSPSRTSETSRSVGRLAARGHALDDGRAGSRLLGGQLAAQRGCAGALPGSSRKTAEKRPKPPAAGQPTTSLWSISGSALGERRLAGVLVDLALPAVGRRGRQLGAGDHRDRAVQAAGERLRLAVLRAVRPPLLREPFGERSSRLDLVAQRRRGAAEGGGLERGDERVADRGARLEAAGHRDHRHAVARGRARPAGRRWSPRSAARRARRRRRRRRASPRSSPSSSSTARACPARPSPAARSRR